MKAFRTLLTLAGLMAAITFVPAQAQQQQQQQPPPQNPPAGQPPAGQRGGGGGGRGGRGAIQIMTITAPWQPGGVIPDKHSQAGRDVSPALSWDGAPDTTMSFALVVHDLNAATQPGTNDVLHWLVWNIPASERSLPEGVPQGAQAANGMRQISQTGPYYRGPAAPASGPAHHYVFELYALDSTIDVPAVGAQGVTVADTRAAVLKAMETHVRGKAVIVGTYKRPAS